MPVALSGSCWLVHPQVGEALPGVLQHRGDVAGHHLGVAGHQEHL
ncbi:hypothetical protein PV341_21740 [Streptomyces sp. PA03-1a]|nr:hypothetical protein [Streptomyces sp. PA03-1a]